MGFGGTAKKIQKIADAAEKLYAKMNEIISELRDLQSDVETTSEQVDRLERELAEQRVLVETLATERGIDVESVIADADLPSESGTPDDAGDSIDVTDEADGR